MGGYWKLVARVTGAVVPSAFLVVLDGAGYVEGTNCQPDEVLLVLNLLFGAGSAFWWILAFVLLFRYRMNEERHRAVMTLVQRRHAGPVEPAELIDPLYGTPLPPWAPTPGRDERPHM